MIEAMGQSHDPEHEGLFEDALKYSVRGEGVAAPSGHDAGDEIKEDEDQQPQQKPFDFPEGEAHECAAKAPECGGRGV